MAYHQTSENRINVYPPTAQTLPTRNAYAQAINVAQTLQRDSGGSAALANTGYTQTGSINTGNTWATQPQFSGEELNYVHFAPNGTFLEGTEAISHAKDAGIQGFVLQDRELYYDLVMTSNASHTISGGASPSADAFTLWHYEVVTGSTVNSASAWKTVGSPTDIKSRFVTHAAQSATPVEIRSLEAAPGNTSFLFHILFRGVVQGRRSTPYLRISWADKKYSLLLPSNSFPVLQRWNVDPNFNGGVPGWANWRELKNAPKIKMSGGSRQLLTVRVRLLAGFLVLDFESGGHVTKIWIADVYTPPTQNGQPNSQADSIIRDVGWGEGRYNIEMDGCQATLGYAALVYRDPLYPAQNEGTDGTFTQTIYTNYPPTVTTTGGGATAGWKKQGTSTEVASTWSANTGGTVTQGGKIEVEVTLHSSRNIPFSGGGVSNGIMTPFVSRYITRNQPAPTPGSAAAIDVSRACREEGLIEEAEPDSTITATATIPFDRQVLEALAPSWQDTVADGSLVVWDHRWKNSDGTYTSWTNVFTGFVQGISKNTNGINAQYEVLHCQDKAMFLAEPYGMIDTRFLPWDFLSMESGLATYGGDVFAYYIETVFGSAESALINGNGDAMRYFPADHYALIDGATNSGGIALSFNTLTLQPQTTQGFLYPPAYNRSITTDIDKIKEMDRAVCYYGLAPGTSTRCFMYGRLDLIQAAQDTAGVQELDDTNYNGDADLNRLIEAAATETLPGHGYNVTRITFGPGVEGIQQGILPPNFVVESRLEDSDAYNSPAAVGERTLVLEYPWIFQRADAQYIADLVMWEFKGRPHFTGEITSRGVDTASYCMLVAPRMNGSLSDDTIGLNAYSGGSVVDTSRLRATHIRHRMLFEERDMKTEWQVRVLSNTGS